MEEKETPTFKMLLLGDGGVGKTTFARRFPTQGEKRYNAVVSVEVYPLEFATTLGPIKFQIWEPVASRGPSCLRDNYYANGHCGILIFDTTSRVSYKNVPRYHADALRVCGENIPLVLCGNKVDTVAPPRKVKPAAITFHRKKDLPYFDISAKANYAVEKPFLWLARKLLGDENLEFVEKLDLADPVAEVDNDLMATYVEQFAEAAQTPFPAEEDDDL